MTKNNEDNHHIYLVTAGFLGGILMGILLMGAIYGSQYKKSCEVIPLPKTFEVGDYVKTTEKANKLTTKIELCRVYKVEGELILCIDANNNKYMMNEFWLTEVSQ